MRFPSAGGGRVMIRVLIAEDQAMVAGALAALLDIEQRHRGRRNRRATAARRSMRSGALRPDVLLTDIEMPEMTGLELAAAVRAERSAPRVVDPDDVCASRGT